MYAMRFTLLYGLVAMSLLGFNPVAHANEKPFALWVLELQQEARLNGISDGIFQQAMRGAEPMEKVIVLDRKQPESTMTMEEYLKKVVPQARIQRARKEYEANLPLLKAVSQRYGVQPEYIVALWAVESNFGERMGNYAIVHSLATLAYDGRRSAFFRKELLNALTILQQGHISVDAMLGSWAGAMGQCQFMPSSFLRYAVDYNGDGRKDIWQTREDVFASIANYLSSEGWKPNKGWGNMQNPADNYHVIMKWNRSRYFATAVGTLAEAIVKKQNAK
jgi:membrane-bound lytic murein transglycosylase B